MSKHSSIASIAVANGERISFSAQKKLTIIPPSSFENNETTIVQLRRKSNKTRASREEIGLRISICGFSVDAGPRKRLVPLIFIAAKISRAAAYRGRSIRVFPVNIVTRVCAARLNRLAGAAQNSVPPLRSRPTDP